MDLKQLDGMASGTVGTAVKTDEFTVDVLGAVMSGNTAEIVLRVTVTPPDGADPDSEAEPLTTYRFSDETVTLLRDIDAEVLSHGYVYSDEDSRLAPNQFILFYSVVSREKLSKKQYTIGLTDFYYYDSAGTRHSYSGSWQVAVACDPRSDTSRTLSVDRELTAGGTGFTLNGIQVTPLACTIHLTCGDEKANTDEFLRSTIFSVFSEASGSSALTLSDGTVLGSRQFTVYPGASGDAFWVILSFNGPAAVDEIASLALFGGEYPLQ